jgi:hypothetical protein
MEELPPAARRGECSQGGYGPPCFFERRTFSADVLCDDMRDYRESWAETHVTLKQRKSEGTIR